MTGDAPQPGETPREDGAPWSHADPASPWWRPAEPAPAGARPATTRSDDPAAATTTTTPTLDPPQPAQHTGEAGDAHRAGGQDTLAALTGQAAPATVFTVPDHPPTQATPPGPAAPTPPATPATSAAPAAAPAAAPIASAAMTAPAVRSPEESKPAELKTGAAPATDSPAGKPASVDQQPAVRKPAAPRHAQRVPDRDHDHHQVDAERFNTQGEGREYTARDQAAGPDSEASIIDVLNTVPVEPLDAGVRPEVMVLPEPDHNRPTVALNRATGPDRPTSRLGLSGADRARADRAHADRALQDRVRQERTAALLETSPFWKAEEERRAQQQAPETQETLVSTRRAPRHQAPVPRRPVSGLLGMLVLGLVAAFFAWVSAEPFWLAVGHGDQGSATVQRCTGSGVTQRCLGRFVATDGAYQVDGLALVGVEADRRAPGASSAARMVRSDSRQAYVGTTGPLMHLRWALSFVLVLLCGLGIAGLTGTRRLDTARARRGAALASVAAPLILLGGFLYVTF